MRHDVRFIVLTRDESFSAEMRALLRDIKDTRIIAEVEEPALLQNVVKQLPAEVLLVNLDPSPETILHLLGDIVRTKRNLAVFAVSESSDGPLILKTMRMGIKEFLPRPIDIECLKEAIDRVVTNQPEAVEQGMLITVVGTSGGVGTTLIAANLAVELAALASGNVTVVDLDHRFGQVATFLDVEPSYTLSDLCSSPEQLDPQMVERALGKHASGTRVLARPQQLLEADSIAAADAVGVFSILTKLNEYVVADGPTRFDVGGKAILAMSDVTLVVIEPLVPCVRNARRLLDGMRENGVSLDRVKLVCNRVGMTPGHLSVKDITQTLGMEAYALLPDDWPTASGAINLGEPLMTNSPKSKLRIAIQEIAQRLYSPDDQTDEREARKQSLIGRIFASG